MNDEMNVLTEAIPQTEMESTEILDQVSEGEAQTAFSQTDSEMCIRDRHCTRQPCFDIRRRE